MKKTVRSECDSPNTPTVCDSPETPTVCDSRTVRFEDENRKTQPTVHNDRQKLSVPEVDSVVPLRVRRSPAVMDRDGQYKTRTGRVVRMLRSVIPVIWIHNCIKQIL